MFKKIIAVMLIIILLFSVTACGNNGNTDTTTTGSKDTAIHEIPETDKKVAILVAPEAQYPEDYRAAQALAEAYPDKVIVKEYPDSRVLTPGDSEIITFSKEIAADPSYGAIVYARATRYTSWSITQAKEAAKKINSDLKIICVEPEESIYDISKKADLVLCADWQAAANDIAAQAKAQGAEHFLFFSFNRHIIDNPMIGGIMNYIKNACEEQGINFIYEASLDSNGTMTEINKAKDYLNEAVVRHIKNETIEGKNVVLFSTDSAVQDRLIELTNENGFIYVSPSFPTAYNGVGDKYTVDLPADIKDVNSYVANVKTALVADTVANGRYCSYNYSLASTLITGAVYCAFDLITSSEEEMSSAKLAETVTARLKAVANNENFTVTNYDPANPVNIFKAYCPGYEIIK